MKYTGKFRNIKDTALFTVDIITNNDESTEKEIQLAAKPVVIKTKGSNKIFDPIRNSSATVSILLGEDENPYFDMYSPTADGTKVIIYKTDDETEITSKIFEGYAEPNIYSQEYNHIDKLELPCIDMIAYLKQKKYTNIGDGPGIHTILDIAAHILCDIGKGEYFRYYCSFQAVDHTYGDTFKDLLFNESNMYDDDEMEEPWTCYKALEEICKFTMTTLVMKYDERRNVLMPHFVPFLHYKIMDEKSPRISYYIYSKEGNYSTLDYPGIIVDSLEINENTHIGKGGKLSLDDTYNKVRVAANTNVPADESGEGESEDVIPDMFTANAILTTKECDWAVVDNDEFKKIKLFHKFYQDNAWETKRWGLNLAPDATLMDKYNVVEAGMMIDFGFYLGGYNGPKVFNWLHDLYAVKMKTAIVDPEEDVKVLWEKYIALGLGIVGLEGCGTNDHQMPFPDSNSKFLPERADIEGKYTFASSILAQRFAFKWHWNMPRMNYPLLKLPQAKSKIIYSPTGAQADWILFNGTCRLSCLNGWYDPRNTRTGDRKNWAMNYQYHPINMPIFYDSTGKYTKEWNDKEFKWFKNSKWKGGMPTICVSVKIGNKYWKSISATDNNGNGQLDLWDDVDPNSYKWNDGEWVDYPTYFYIPIGKNELESERDYQVTNTVNYATGIEESGWAIPIRASDNVSGQIEIIFYPPLLYTNESKIASGSACRNWLPAALLLKDFKIGYYAQKPEGYFWEDDVDEDTDANDDADNEYAAIATEPWAANYVEEGDDIELDFNTLNPAKDHSYSSVLRYTNVQGDTDYLQNVYDIDPRNNSRIDVDQSPEHKVEMHIAQKYWQHYGSPKKIYEWTMDDFVNPDTRCYYNTLADSSVFIVNSQSWDVRNDQNKIKITEI